MHVCTTPCLSAAAPACMHGGVFICKGPGICAERHACLHTSVYVCSAACLCARPRARVLWILPVNGVRKPWAFLKTNFDEPYR